MATLRLAIDARKSQEGEKVFAQSADNIKRKASEIVESMSGMQDKIESSFTFASFDTSSLDQIKKQFEMNANELPILQKEMSSRLYAATHTQLETQLNDHKIYFDELRTKWQFNESMLTSINQTETAERKKILDNFTTDYSRTMSRILRTGFKIGFATYAISSFMDMGTSMLEAKRKGESTFDAFLSGLPIINRLADSAKGLAKELSGLAAVEIISGKALSLDEKYENLSKTMYRNIQLAKAGTDSAAVQAKFDYEDRLKEIDAIEKEVKAIKEWNKAIDEQIKKGKLINVGFGGAGSTVPLSEGEISALNTKKIAVPNIDVLRRQASQEYGTDGAHATDYMGSARATNESARKQLDDLDARRKAAVQSASAVSGMYADMGDYGDEYWNAVNIQLNYQVRQFKAAGASDVDAAKWRANELKRLEDEIASQKASTVSGMYADMGDYGDEYWNATKVLLDDQVKQFKDAGASDVDAAKWRENELKRIEDEIAGLVDEDAIVLSATQAASLIEQMYSDMGKYGDEYFAAIGILLDDQVRQFKDAGASDVEIAKWRASELKRIEDEIAESRKNSIERWVDHYTDMGEITNEFAESYAANLDDLGSKMTDWMKTGKMDWESWTNSLLTSWMDTLNKMAVATAQESLVNPLINSVVGGIVSAWGGGSNIADGVVSDPQIGEGTATGIVAHGGGIIGSTNFPTRQVPSSLFANAPRFHNGLKSNERKAILEVGEEVTSKEDVRRGKNKNNNLQTSNYQPQITLRPIIVRNEQEAFDEYIRTPKGQKAIIYTVANNKDMLG